MCADFQNEIWNCAYFKDNNNLRAYCSASLMFETLYFSYTKILMKIKICNFPCLTYSNLGTDIPTQNMSCLNFSYESTAANFPT